MDDTAFNQYAEQARAWKAHTEAEHATALAHEAEAVKAQVAAENAAKELKLKNLRFNGMAGTGILAGTAGLLGGLYGGKKLWDHYHRPPAPMPPMTEAQDTETPAMPDTETPKQANEGLLPPRLDNALTSIDSLVEPAPLMPPSIPPSMAQYDLDFMPDIQARDALVQQLMEPKQAHWLGDMGRRIAGRSPEYIQQRNAINALGKAKSEQDALTALAQRHGVPHGHPGLPEGVGGAAAEQEQSFLQRNKWPLIGAGGLGAGYLAYQNGAFGGPQGEQFMQPKFSHDRGYTEMLARLGLIKSAAPAIPAKAMAASFKGPASLAKKSPPPIPDKAKGPSKDFKNVQRTMGFGQNSPPAIKKAAFEAGYVDALVSLGLRKLAARPIAAAGKGAGKVIKRVATSADDAMRASAMSGASSNLSRVPGMGGGAAAKPVAPRKPVAPKPAAPAADAAPAPAAAPRKRGAGMIPPGAPTVGPNPNKTMPTLQERKPQIAQHNAQKLEADKLKNPDKYARGFQHTTTPPPAAVTPPPPAAVKPPPATAGAGAGAPTPPPAAVKPPPAAAGAGAPTPPPAAAGAATAPAAAGGAAAAEVPAQPGAFRQGLGKMREGFNAMPAGARYGILGGGAGLAGLGIGGAVGSAMQPDVNVVH
jgi:hypothetical protein